MTVMWTPTYKYRIRKEAGKLVVERRWLFLPWCHCKNFWWGGWGDSTWEEALLQAKTYVSAAIKYSHGDVVYTCQDARNEELERWMKEEI